MDINDSKVNELLNEIELVRRRKIIDYSKSQDLEFIDPYKNLLKLQAPNNHIILARRGCGKTTILLKSLENICNSLVAVVDCQFIKNKSAGKSLISILLVIFKSLQEDFSSNDWEENKKKAKKNIVFYKVFSSTNKKNKEKYKDIIKFEKIVKLLTLQIENLKSSPDELIFKEVSTQTTKIKNESKFNMRNKLKVNLKANQLDSLFKSSLNLESEINSIISSTKTNNKVNETTFEREINFSLYDFISDSYKEKLVYIFEYYNNISSKNIVLYMDDFYLFSHEIQPHIIEFFHDIYKVSKNSSFCFKVSALPYRINANPKNKTDLSYKDDFSTISLDVNLSEFDTLVDYLILIICHLKLSIKLESKDIESLFNNKQVLEYSIMAAGGIPRDFMLILSDLIHHARAEGRNKIGKTDVYAIIKRLRDDKEQNIEFDADLDQLTIRSALDQIVNVFLLKHNTNVFLYPKKNAKKDEALLRNLSNLRYIHLIKDNISSETKKNENFDAYLIDMTFYATGKRMRRDFTLREFWVKDNKQRYPELHRAPIWCFENINKD